LTGTSPRYRGAVDARLPPRQYWPDAMRRLICGSGAPSAIPGRYNGQLTSAPWGNVLGCWHDRSRNEHSPTNPERCAAARCCRCRLFSDERPKHRAQRSGREALKLHGGTAASPYAHPSPSLGLLVGTGPPLVAFGTSRLRLALVATDPLGKSACARSLLEWSTINLNPHLMLWTWLQALTSSVDCRRRSRSSGKRALPHPAEVKSCLSNPEKRATRFVHPKNC
jgi:hypothetical protein